MIKHRWLAAAAVGALLGGGVPPRPAYALFGVGDIVFDPTTFVQVAQEAENGLNQIRWLTNLFGCSTAQLQQLTTFYNAFAHVTNVSQLAGVLSTTAQKAPMLNDALQLEQAFRGFGLTTTLASKVQSILQQSQYYAAPATDFNGWHLNTQTTATAGHIASAQDAYTAAVARSNALTQLLNSVGSADPKTILDLSARGPLEAATAVAQTNQLMAASLLQQAQRDQASQQGQQGFRYSADVLHQTYQRALAAAQGGAVNLVTP